MYDVAAPVFTITDRCAVLCCMCVQTWRFWRSTLNFPWTSPKEVSILLFLMWKAVWQREEPMCSPLDTRTPPGLQTKISFCFEWCMWAHSYSNSWTAPSDSGSPAWTPTPSSAHGNWSSPSMRPWWQFPVAIWWRPSTPTTWGRRPSTMSSRSPPQRPIFPWQSGPLRFLSTPTCMRWVCCCLQLLWIFLAFDVPKLLRMVNRGHHHLPRTHLTHDTN